MVTFPRITVLRPILGVLAMAGVHQSHSSSQDTCNHSPERIFTRGMEENKCNTGIGDFAQFQLRRDQRRNMVGQYNNDHVYVCAPEWVKDAILTLQSKTQSLKTLELKGDAAGANPLRPTSTLSYVLEWVNQLRTFLFPSSLQSTPRHPVENISLSTRNKLVWLQLLARNEILNVDGIISTNLYAPAIDDPGLIVSLKDLVRQTVIVGQSTTSHYGGYRQERIEQKARVYVCDLSALQFQQEYNSGRLVLLRQLPLPSGHLDDLIFENATGEPRKKYEEVNSSISDGSDRYIPCKSKVFGSVLFDTVAYRKFVSKDVVLAGLSLNHLANHYRESFHFKFLKYGTGFFAEDFQAIIDKNILAAVLEGLEELFVNHGPVWIKSIELPFFEPTDDELRDVQKLKNKLSIEITFSKEDALKETGKGSITATTNCADPHAVFGNEMGCRSVDAAIAENLEDKGNQFSPLLNSQMTEIYFKLISKL